MLSFPPPWPVSLSFPLTSSPCVKFPFDGFCPSSGLSSLCGDLSSFCLVTSSVGLSSAFVSFPAGGAGGFACVMSPLGGSLPGGGAGGLAGFLSPPGAGGCAGSFSTNSSGASIISSGIIDIEKLHRSVL